MRNRAPLLLWLMLGTYPLFTVGCPTCVGRIPTQQEPFFHEHIQQILATTPPPALTGKSRTNKTAESKSSVQRHSMVQKGKWRK